MIKFSDGKFRFSHIFDLEVELPNLEAQLPNELKHLLGLLSSQNMWITALDKLLTAGGLLIQLQQTPKHN